MALTPTIVAQAAVQHPTTAAAGTGGTLSIVIMSTLIHLGVHLTEEEALAWCSLIIAMLGWFLRFASKRWPVLDINAPVVPPADPVVVEPVTAGGGVP